MKTTHLSRKAIAIVAIIASSFCFASPALAGNSAKPAGAHISPTGKPAILQTGKSRTPPMDSSRHQAFPVAVPSVHGCSAIPMRMCDPVP